MLHVSAKSDREDVKLTCEDYEAVKKENHEKDKENNELTSKLNQLSIDFNEGNETIKTLEARRIELNEDIRTLRHEKASFLLFTPSRSR